MRLPAIKNAGNQSIWTGAGIASAKTSATMTASSTPGSPVRRCPRTVPAVGRLRGLLIFSPTIREETQSGF
jgi:hypothetical protein